MFWNMKKLKLLVIMTSCVLLTGAILPGNLFADTVIEEWVAGYNGPANSNDWAHAIALDSSGNVYVTGRSDGGLPGAPNNDFAAVKYDSNGNQLWVARYNGPGNFQDVAVAIALDSSGVYVAGYSYGGSTSNEYATVDYATIKYDTNGNELWVARYNGPGNNLDVVEAIAVDTSGNVYVTGTSIGDGTDRDFATVKYDASTGQQLWVARYNGPANSHDVAFAIALDSSGVYVTGMSQGSGPTGDYATVKYDTSTGQQLWVARYNGPANSWDLSHAIALDSLGNVYVTGYSDGYGTSYDYATIKYDTDGTELWVARYNGPGNSSDNAIAIAVDTSGNVYVTGYSGGDGTSQDFATVKFDASTGQQLWVARYNGPGNSRDWAHAIALDSSGNVYVTGRSEGDGTSEDYATVKYDTSTGQQLWVARYNGPANFRDLPDAIALDSSGNVYVTGVTGARYASTSTQDFATVKYSQPQPPAAPVIGVVDYDEADDSTTVAGTADPGADITIYDENGDILCETTADEDGNWQCILFGDLEGAVITVTATGPGGESPPVQPPAAPVIGVVDYDEAAGTTTVSGTTEPGAIIRIYDENGNLIYETTADENGYWECFVSGNYEGSSITVTASDEDGNTSPPSQPPVPTWPDGSTLTAPDVGLMSLTLTWTPAEHDVGVAEYLLFEGGMQIGIVAGTETTCQVTGLVFDTQYTFKVEACDGQGYCYCSTDGPSLTVRTLTPVEAIEQLVAEVLALNLQNGISNSLDAKLDAVLRALDDANQNNDVAAINALEAFINAIEAQRGNMIPEDDADSLIATAQAAIDALNSL